MTTDIEVSMDDVVSAFVSQYENNLFDRKKELGKDIRKLESDLEDVEKTVRKTVTGTEFKQTGMPFGLKVIVNEGSVRWTENPKPHVTFAITVEEKDSSRYSNKIHFNKDKPIPAALVKKYNKIADALKEIRTDLNEVLINLKSVNRKERQVRGRIAMRKLEDSGYASLMQDDELLQLVQLED